jgi:uncharacterized protein DUF5302
MAETGDQHPDGTEDEVRRKFREALEQKRAKGRSADRGQRSAAQGVGPASNDKSQRQFRRKSGG